MSQAPGSNVGLQLNFLFQSIQQQVDELRAKFTALDPAGEEAEATRQKLDLTYNLTTALSRETRDSVSDLESMIRSTASHAREYTEDRVHSLAGEMLNRHLPALEERMMEAFNSRVEQMQVKFDAKIERIIGLQGKLNDRLDEVADELRSLEKRVERQATDLQDSEARLGFYQDTQSAVNEDHACKLSDISLGTIPGLYLKIEQDNASIDARLGAEVARLSDLQDTVTVLSQQAKRLEGELTRARGESSDIALDLDSRTFKLNQGLGHLKEEMLVLATAQKSNERNNEKIKAWVLNEIKKQGELMELDAAAGVKCLVCNHVTVQRQQQDVVPSVDAFRTILGPHHNLPLSAAPATEQQAGGVVASSSPITPIGNATAVSPTNNSRRKLASLLTGGAAASSSSSPSLSHLLPADAALKTYFQREQYMQQQEQSNGNGNAKISRPSSAGPADGLVAGSIVINLGAALHTTTLPPPKQTSPQPGKEPREYFAELASKFPSSPDRGNNARPSSASAVRRQKQR